MMSKVLIVFFSFLFMMTWLIIYKKSYDGPRKRKKITLWISSHFSGDAKKIYYYAVLILYLGLPLFFGWLLLKLANIPCGNMFAVNPDLQISPVYLSITAFVGGVTLSILAIILCLRLCRELIFQTTLTKLLGLNQRWNSRRILLGFSLFPVLALRNYFLEVLAYLLSPVWE